MSGIGEINLRAGKFFLIDRGEKEMRTGTNLIFLYRPEDKGIQSPQTFISECKFPKREGFNEEKANGPKLFICLKKVGKQPSSSSNLQFLVPSTFRPRRMSSQNYQIPLQRSRTAVLREGFIILLWKNWRGEIFAFPYYHMPRFMNKS
ncbi:hypothetical protein CEXT_340851 [Caerostris extrusa]|uniref:Uncharacterized protein n=1 Tax=Caerostris extrusa TaxID=172846 RepID=A0AAV4NBR5_CAEEX|nr:hypothetical protein CEXT_340851 [Caerostris extrusa]